MGLSKQISSPQNPLVKRIGVLQEKSRERRKTGLFVLEGLRELQLAIRGGYVLDTVLFQEDLVSKDDLRNLLDASETQPEIIEITKEIYQKLAYRSTTEGVLALAGCKPHSLNDLIVTSKNPLILIAEAPEKPGNIGALLRTADAAGLDAVIIANPKTDLYNPNIVRSSVGCVFTNHIATGSTSEVISLFKGEKHTLLLCSLVRYEKLHRSRLSGSIGPYSGYRGYGTLAAMAR